MAWQNPFTRPQQQQAPVQQASQQAQNGPQNPQFQTPTGAPNVQTNPGQPGTQNPVNPLDAIATQIWGSPQTQQQQQPGQPQGSMAGNQQPGTQQAPAYKGYTVPWNNDQVSQAMQRVDFMQGVPQETLQRLQGGDWSALNEIVNHVGRTATTMSMQAAHGFVDRGVQSGLDRFGGSLDDRFRDYEIKRQNPDDALISHPANAPVFDMLKQQVAKNNPNATPEQIKGIATQWFKEMANSMNSNNQQQNQNQSQNEGPNWMESLGMEDPNGNQNAGLPGANTSVSTGSNGSFGNGF